VTFQSADVAYAKNVLAFESLLLEGFEGAYDMFRNHAWHAIMTVFIADSEGRMIGVEEAFGHMRISAQVLNRYVRLLISIGIFCDNTDIDRPEVHLTEKATLKLREILQRMNTTI
jgi:hypothetical protein